MVRWSQKEGGSLFLPTEVCQTEIFRERRSERFRCLLTNAGSFSSNIEPRTARRRRWRRAAEVEQRWRKCGGEGEIEGNVCLKENKEIADTDKIGFMWDLWISCLFEDFYLNIFIFKQACQFSGVSSSYYLLMSQHWCYSLLWCLSINLLKGAEAWMTVLEFYWIQERKPTEAVWCFGQCPARRPWVLPLMFAGTTATWALLHTAYTFFGISWSRRPLSAE